MRALTRHAVGAVVGASLAATLAVSGAAGAVAVAPNADDGRWYYSATGLAELHQRTTGEGITVALLDGRVNPAAADLAGADVQPHEPAYCAAERGGTAYPATTTDADAEHSTSMATMLVGQDAGVGGQPGIPGVAPGVTLRTYSIIVAGSPCETPAGQESSQDDALRDALADGADIIAVPGNNEFSSAAVGEALRAGAIIVAAGGNDGALTGLPAGFNGVLSVGTVTPDVTLAEGSPYGEQLGAVAPGAYIREMLPTWDAYWMTTGSSNATAYTAGAIALLWSLYPDATSGQVLQALIHTTDGRVNDTPTHDPAWGYGTVSPRALLSVDPTTYPDENPFLLDDPGAVPSMDQVLGTTGEASSAASTENSAEGGAAPEQSAAAPETPWATIIGGFAAIVVVGAVVLAVVRARRRPHEPGHRPDHDAPPTYSRGNHG
ncbi:S8 family peptidase [Cellulomonas sp. Y8]|uniref:S8 family peptidase n=1 Tax=Cellulomonas sp. Y8 TaxID=2591145 RepID=UPI003D72C19D